MPYATERYKVVIDQTYHTIKTKIYETRANLRTVCYRTSEPVPYSDRMNGEELHLAPGDNW